MSYILPLNKVKRFRRIEHRKENIIPIYRDTQHVRFFKLFPMCNIGTDEPIGSFKIFHMRAYFPKELFIHSERKIDRVILMFNGLNEVHYFTTYDQLGYFFATHGIASILLPIPNHLNRHTYFRNYETRLDNFKTPFEVMKSEPMNMFNFYRQYMGEINFLLRHLRGIKCHDERCGFFRKYFDKNTRISCLGYSLGGLAALASFLSNKETYNSCVLLNSGIKLANIDTERMIKKTEWLEFIKQLDNEILQVPKKKMDNYYKYFHQIFLGYNTLALRDELKEYAKKILFIFGGKDITVPSKEIEDVEDKQYGLSIFKIPGLDHFLYNDEEWDKWLDFIVNLIIKYDDNAAYRYITRNELFRRYHHYNVKYNFSGNRKIFDYSSIGTLEEKKELDDLYFTKLYYFSDNNKDFINSYTEFCKQGQF